MVSPARGDRSFLVDLALIGIGLAIFLAVPHSISGDGAARFATIERLLSTGHLESARYSVVMPLFATPLYALGRAVGHVEGTTALFNALLFAVAVALLARQLGGLVAPATRRTFLLLLVYGSMFPAHLLAFYGEVFTALAVTLGVLWLARGRPILGWVAIVLGAVNTPATILATGAIALRHAWATRRWAPLSAPVLALALSRLESLAVRGTLLGTGYEHDAGFPTALPYSGAPGFSYPFFFGVLAILFSFGKGLAFFAPGLFWPVAKGASPRLLWAHGTLVAFVVGLVVVYAKWWAWYGGWFWGPRFFLVASVPASLALATQITSVRGTLARAWLLAAGVALSFWVGVDGLAFGQRGLDVCSEDRYAVEAFCHYVPEMSALFHPFVHFPSIGIGAPEGIVCVFWAAVLAWVARGVFAEAWRGAVHAVTGRFTSLRDGPRPALGRL
jgi:hypothetical protein